MHSFLHLKDLIKSYFSGGVVCTLLLLLVCGAVSAEEKTITITSSKLGLTSSYALKTATIDGFSFSIDLGFLSTNPKGAIQMNSSRGNGILYNTTPIKGLKSIKVNVASGNKQYTVTTGTTQKPTTQAGTGTTTSTIDINNKGDEYFQLKVSGASYFSSIEVIYDNAPSAPFSLTTTSAEINTGETYDLSKAIAITDGYNGTITYSSEDASIANVSEEGVITGIGEGKTNITIKADADGDFAEHSETFAITVVKPDLRSEPNLTWNKPSYDPYFDTEDKTFPTLSYAEGFDGDITYSSTNTDIATINEKGEINILSAGETTITASFAGNESWKEGTASYTLNIKKHITELSFGTETTYNINLSETFVSPKASAAIKMNKEYDGTITYSSSAPSIADINETTGEVEIKSAGTVTITATAPATNAWTEAIASYTLNIIDPNAQVGYQYKLITSENEITDGCKFLLSGKVNNDAYALSNSNNNNFTSTKVIIDANDIISVEKINEDNNPFEVTINKVEGGYTLKLSNNKYLSNQRTQTTKANYLRTVDNITNDNGTIWTITFSNANAIIKNTYTSNTGNKVESSIRLNPNTNNGSPLFSCYGISAQNPVSLYKKIETVSNPTVTITEAQYATYVTTCDVEFGDEVTAYVVDKINDTDVSIKQITSAPANTPVIVYADIAETTTFQLTRTSNAEEVGINELEYKDAEFTNETHDIYVLSKKNGVVGFRRLALNEVVPARKVYITRANTTTAEAKEFMPIGGNTTGITNITDDNNNAKKIYYNLNGMRVDNPQKGIYIVNGKKVIF